MKRSIWMIAAAVLIAGLAQASVTTNFYADLTGSSDGAADGANLNAGTDVGSWNAASQLDSYVTNGVANLGTGTYNYQLWIPAASVPALADSPTVHLEFRAAAPKETSQWNLIQFKDENGANLLSLRINAWSAIQRWTGSTWTAIATSTIYGTADVPTTLNVLEVSFTSAGADITYNGTLIEEAVSYLSGATGSSLRYIQLIGSDSTSTMWYDNIHITTTSVDPGETITHFDSTLEGSSDGAANNANLNAGTAVGSWNANNQLDSYVTNGIVNLGTGTYNYQLWIPSDNIPALADSPSAHLELRAASPKETTQWNLIQFKDENGANLLNLRVNAWSAIQRWTGSTWAGIATSTTYGTVDVPATLNELDIDFTASGADITYNGTLVEEAVSYLSGATGSSLRYIQLIGSDSTSTMWYDNVNITTVIPLVTNFTGWASWKGLSGDDALPTADLEPDGMDNLLEYALGGDPTVDDAATILPVAAMNGSYLEYVYQRRTDYVSRGLDYTVKTETALVDGSGWTNANYTVSVGPADGDFEPVTNRIDTALANQRFVRLQVQEN